MPFPVDRVIPWGRTFDEYQAMFDLAATDLRRRILQEEDMNETKIRLHVEQLPEGVFLATSADVPGLVAEGRSVAEAAEVAQGLARKIAESCVEHGDALPPALMEHFDADAKLDLLVPVSVP